MMRKALIVGIDDYTDCPLKGCCNDSDEIRRLLERHENGDLNFEIKQENNVNSKDCLRGLINECFSGSADVALFYYSGHGMMDSVGGYLVTPDYAPGAPGISMQDILAIANASKCKNKVIILDCCQSGFMGSISTEGQDTAVIREGVAILTASRRDEYAIESGGHGIFTSLLIEALEGGAADITGHITIGSVYAFVDKALGAWDQRPVFKTNVSRFTSLRDVNPRVGSDVIRKIGEYFPDKNISFPLDPSFEPTNDKNVEHELMEPYAKERNVKIFEDLQKLVKIGIVTPVGEDHMYFAAMHSKSCALTALGKHYWKLVHDEKI